MRKTCQCYFNDPRIFLRTRKQKWKLHDCNGDGWLRCLSTNEAFDKSNDSSLYLFVDAWTRNINWFLHDIMRIQIVAQNTSCINIQHSSAACKWFKLISYFIVPRFTYYIIVALAIMIGLCLINIWTSYFLWRIVDCDLLINSFFQPLTSRIQICIWDNYTNQVLKDHILEV